MLLRALRVQSGALRPSSFLRAVSSQRFSQGDRIVSPPACRAALSPFIFITQSSCFRVENTRERDHETGREKISHAFKPNEVRTSRVPYNGLNALIGHFALASAVIYIDARTVNTKSSTAESNARDQPS